MFRNLVKFFEPIRNHLLSGSRVGVANTAGGANGAANGSAFDRNSVTKEEQLSTILRQSLPGITFLSVEDISGGCGAMFEISIEAKEFIGLSTIKQHRLVTNTLKEEIAEMHGIRIHTTPTPAQNK